MGQNWIRLGNFNLANSGGKEDPQKIDIVNGEIRVGEAEAEGMEDC